MLPEINQALQRLLYEWGHIPDDEVDIRFEAPTKDWIESLTRPTIDVFLRDVQENTELRRVDYQMTRNNTRARLELPPRRIELHYMISAITTELEDEHRLLWRTMTTLMRYPNFPAETLPEALRDVEPPLSGRALQPEDGSRALDLWSALGAPPRPTLSYVLTAPLFLDRSIDAPLVLTRSVRYTSLGPAAG
jgi:hypothetical protein